MLSWNVIKDVLPILFFEVGLQTTVVYSDIILTLTWFRNGHWKYASAMAVPLLLNFLPPFLPGVG